MSNLEFVLLWFSAVLVSTLGILLINNFDSNTSMRSYLAKECVAQSRPLPDYMDCKDYARVRLRHLKSGRYSSK